MNSGVKELGRFTNLKTLVLDHNNFTNMRYFPELPQLETLSLAYNSVRDLESTLTTIHTKYPCIKHLNFIKNPINPMFSGQAQKYDEFRAKFKIWLPTLETLDGTDFSKDDATIAKLMNTVETQKAKAMKNAAGLDTVEEQKKEDVDADGLLKKGTGKNASGGQRSYQFNQRAYKKYHSTKSLVERILKSHSEGNRFIRNEDL